MGLFQRVNTVVVAQLHEFVDVFEEPERMLKQAIREMEAALQRATESTAKAIAGEKRLRRQLADCQARTQLWRDQAVHSVKEGNDAAARAALSRKGEGEKAEDALVEQIARSAETSEELRRQLDSMRHRLEEARRRLTSLIARKRSAEARKQFLRALGSFDSDVSAFARFEELSRRVDQIEAEAETMTDLLAPRSDEVPIDRTIEAELAALKQERGNSLEASQ